MRRCMGTHRREQHHTELLWKLWRDNPAAFVVLISFILEVDMPLQEVNKNQWASAAKVRNDFTGYENSFHKKQSVKGSNNRKSEIYIYMYIYP